MIKLSKIQVFILLAVFFLPLMMPAEEKKLEVTISSEKNVYTVGEKIEVSITLENVSSQLLVIEIPAIFYPQDYYVEFMLVNNAGDKIEFTGPELRALWTKKTMPLLNNYKYSSTFNLSKFYKLKPGKYKLNVTYDTKLSKMFDIKVDSIRAVSNTFSFEIK